MPCRGEAGECSGSVEEGRAKAGEVLLLYLEEGGGLGEMGLDEGDGDHVRGGVTSGEVGLRC